MQQRRRSFLARFWALRCCIDLFLPCRTNREKHRLPERDRVLLRSAVFDAILSVFVEQLASCGTATHYVCPTTRLAINAKPINSVLLDEFDRFLETFPFDSRTLAN
jgi:hypothetical protein